jgi:polar amino acid transport system substrate-binding protein
MYRWAAVLWLGLAVPVQGESVVIATTGTFPPYLWEDGQVRGFDIDLMDEICRRRGLDCTYTIHALLPGLEAVARGDADVALGGIGISEEREAYGDFTCPYEAGGQVRVPILARDEGVDPATARIAVLGGSLSHRSLQEEGYAAVPFDDLESAIRSVLTGETDAYHGNRGSLDLVPGANRQLVEIGAIESSGTGPAFLVSSARPRLLAAINDTLAVLHRDGHLEDIARPWFAPGSFDAPANMAEACGPVVTARASATRP